MTERSLRMVHGIGPEMTLLISMLENLRDETVTQVQGMSDEDLAWEPPTGKSVGRLLWHIAAAELFALREVFGGVPADDDLWRAAGCQPGRGDELEVPRRPLEAWLSDLNDVRQASLRVLEVSRDTALDSLYEHPEKKGQRRQGRWLLYHVLTHEAYHRGQIAMVLAQRRRAE
ncbi:MAG: DinB family protein [Armatimonadetes bacterium]|nr:DinB family protein [Armatimonadota bacterium]